MGTTIVKAPPSYITLIVKTDNLNAGSSAENQFRLWHQPFTNYNYKIDWGDGTSESVVSTGNTFNTHTYPSVGTYTIKIRGIYPWLGTFVNPNSIDGLKLLRIPTWDMRNPRNDVMFFTASNLSYIPFFDASRMASAQSVFRLPAITQFPKLDLSSAVNCSFAWLGSSRLVSFPAVKFRLGSNFVSAWNSCSSMQYFATGVFDNLPSALALNCFTNTWTNCTSLTSQSVENILVSIDTSGRTAPAGATETQADITITYNVATGALSSATNTAITNLKAKGWKPRINGVYV